jgi:hypothetical protein
MIKLENDLSYVDASGKKCKKNVSTNKVLDQNIESKVAVQGETRSTDRKVAKFLLCSQIGNIKVTPAGNIKVTDSKILKLISIVLS